MERRNINLIIHVLVPFFIMVLIQQLLLILFVYLRMDRFMADLISFVLSAAGGVTFFKIIKFDTELSTEEENDGAASPIAPLEKCRRGVAALYVLFGVGALIVLMFFITALSGEAGNSRSLGVATILSLCLVHPIAEEYLFRGLFYGELRMMHPSFGCLVQAIMFAIIHDSIYGMIFALASGIVFGIIIEKTGRLSTVIVIHTLINLRSLLWSTALADFEELIYYTDVILVAAGLLSFIILAAIKRIDIIKHNSAAYAEE